jgi:hypothetical protein
VPAAKNEASAAHRPDLELAAFRARVAKKKRARKEARILVGQFFAEQLPQEKIEDLVEEFLTERALEAQSQPPGTGSEWRQLLLWLQEKIKNLEDKIDLLIEHRRI